MEQPYIYIRFGQHISGPVDTKQLHHMADTGQITDAHMISINGRDWVSPRKVDGLFPDSESASASKARNAAVSGITQYYIRFGQRVSGPVGAEQLRHMAETGQVTNVHMISTNGRDWVASRDVGGLFPDAEPVSETVSASPTLIAPNCSPRPSFAQELDEQHSSDIQNDGQVGFVERQHWHTDMADSDPKAGTGHEAFQNSRSAGSENNKDVFARFSDALLSVDKPGVVLLIKDKRFLILFCLFIVAAIAHWNRYEIWKWNDHLSDVAGGSLLGFCVIGLPLLTVFRNIIIKNKGDILFLLILSIFMAFTVLKVYVDIVCALKSNESIFNSLESISIGILETICFIIPSVGYGVFKKKNIPIKLGIMTSLVTATMLACANSVISPSGNIDMRYFPLTILLELPLAMLVLMFAAGISSVFFNIGLRIQSIRTVSFSLALFFPVMTRMTTDALPWHLIYPYTCVLLILFFGYLSRWDIFPEKLKALYITETLDLKDHSHNKIKNGKFCPECGALQTQNRNFCTKCGTRIS